MSAKLKRVAIMIIAMMSLFQIHTVMAAEEAAITDYYNQYYGANGMLGHDNSYSIMPEFLNGRYVLGKVADVNTNEALDTVNLIRYIAGLEGVGSDQSLSDEAMAAAIYYRRAIGRLEEPIRHEIVPDMPENYFKMAKRVFETGIVHNAQGNIMELLYNTTGGLYFASEAEIRDCSSRINLLDPKLSEVGFGYVDGIATMAVKKEGDGNYPDNHAVCWPAPGDMPLDFFIRQTKRPLYQKDWYMKAVDTPWSIQLDPSVYGDQQRENIKIEIEELATGKKMVVSETDPILPEETNAFLNINESDAHVITFRPDISLWGYYADICGQSYRITVNGLTTVNGTQDSLTYETRFYAYNPVKSGDYPLGLDNYHGTQILRKLTPGITAYEVIQNIHTNYQYQASYYGIFDENGNEVPDGQPVTTGMDFVRYDSRQYYTDKIPIILFGDLTKDVKISMSDLLLLRNNVMNGDALDQGQLIAADINRDGLITVNDTILLRNYVFDGQQILQ